MYQLATTDLWKGRVDSETDESQFRVFQTVNFKDLTESDIVKIREIIEKEKTVEGDLRREVNLNIRRLIDIGSYKGQRHRRGLPVRGQRTRTNARAKRGPRMPVAGRGQKGKTK